MADNKSRSRDILKEFFEAGDIPEARHYASLIHSSFNQIDDGIKKAADSPLKIGLPNNGMQDILWFYDSFPEPGSPTTPKWRIRLGPESEDLSISDSEEDEDIRFLIKAGGRIGIGTTAPSSALHVIGEITANSFAGQIKPSVGSAEDDGILFSQITEGEIQRTATIRYVQRSTSPKGTNLEIGVKPLSQGEVALAKARSPDHIILLPSGNVGIHTDTPRAELHVNGHIQLEENFLIKGDRKIQFFNTNTTNIKIELKPKVGIGIGDASGLIYYQASGQHTWRESSDGQDWMILENGPTGCLKVLGGGTSSIGGDLSVNGTGSFAENVAVQGKLQIVGNTEMTGDMLIPGGNQIRFGEGSDVNLKIQLKSQVGLGIKDVSDTQSTLYYAAAGKHAWGDAAMQNEWMLLQTGTLGGLTVFGEGLSSFGGNLAVTGKGTFNGDLEVRGQGTSRLAGGLQVDGQLRANDDFQIAGNIALPGARQLVFQDTDHTHLKIQLRTDQGFGLSDQAQTVYYAANGKHSWRNSKGAEERMALSTAANGGLTVKGTGSSSFAGTVSVTGVGTSFIKDQLAVGKDKVDTGYQFDVDGKARANSFHSRGIVVGSTIKAGNAEITNKKIKIGNTEIRESDLKVLKDLANNRLYVSIWSKSDYVMENYKDREGDGDANRSIQFRTSSSSDRTKMQLRLWR